MIYAYAQYKLIFCLDFIVKEWNNFTNYTYHNQTNLLYMYLVNVFKIQIEINRKMTADVWAIFG